MKSSRIRPAIAVVIATSAALHASAATRYMYDAIDDVRVAPFLETSWGQGVHQVQGAYNYYTHHHYVCGCVATSNAKGIYALVLPAGEYRITAGAEGEYSRRVVKVVATEGAKRADGGAQNVAIGNQCDIDLVPASVVDKFVEYVEATGSQYVDTGVEGRAGTKAQFKFTTTEPYQNDQMILGSRSTGGSNRIVWLESAGHAGRRRLQA